MQIRIKGQRPNFILLLSFAYAAGSLCSAYLVEHYQKVPACALCVYQRIALGAVVVCFPFVWMLFKKCLDKRVYLLIPFLYLINFGIAAYHVGVEQHIVPAPSQCLSALAQHGGDVDLLRNLLLQQDIVPCDKVSWRLFGLSMAACNMLASFGILLLWGCVLRQKRLVKRHSL